MAENKNALAELAETMSTPIEPAPVNARGLIVLNGKQLEAYQKAGRIVAELAKEKDEEDTLFSMENITADEARRIIRQREGNCILKCRAIAAE